MPLLRDGRVTGAFSVYADEQGFFSDEMMDLLGRLGGKVAEVLPLDLGIRAWMLRQSG